MSKELVISSTRHETKVATLEDDQLVEIYFQRANEYSLAGSIHKGRVTRVLPGMQSAFVDLGLERDTFLYVSDFFEENADEYDTIAESKPPRPQRSATVVVSPPEPAISLPPAVEEPPAAAPDVSPERTDDGDGRDRRGRRSRRRRGRGKGFPDSKYASDLAPAPHTAEPVEEENSATQEEVILLPGESLAKYRRTEQNSRGPEETAARREAAPLESEEPAALGEELAKAQQLGDDAPSVGSAASAEPVPDTDSVVAIAEPEPEPVHPNETNAEEFAEEIEAAREEAEEPLLHMDAAIDSNTAEEVEETDVEYQQDGDEGQDEATPDIAEQSESAEQADGPSATAADQPLSANVREQGGRYMHRANRRMRRKMRGQQPGGEIKAPAAQVAAVEEVRGPRPEQTKDKTQPSISDLLREGQEIIVQIAKEPLGQKGARITSHIALPGRYVVYMPTLEHLGVSRKISTDEERQRLKRILQTHHVGLTGGFIVRTAGEGRSEQDIAADMAFLYNLWLDIRQKAEKHPAPILLHHDLEIVQRILRDQLNEDYKAVWVDNEDTYESVLRFMQRFQPALVSRVKLYTRSAPIFDAYNITNELEKALRPKVWLKSGGYIVINQTEALVAIDVNTGKYVGKSNRLEDTIVKTNLEAVKEIVRQVRLRDLGGIIVVDFIDMDERKNRQKVMQALEDAMRADRAPYKLLQFNDFGLVAITRKRVKQSLERTLCSPCPTCEGSGYVKSVQTVVGEIIQEAMKLRNVIEDKHAILRCHPDIAKFLKSVDNKYLEELEEILGRPVAVTADPTTHPEKFDLT